MAGVLETVDQRTQLVGENRLELLMFTLRCKQVYAINVFKVQEVQKMPKLTLIPNRNPLVAGVTHVRGQTIPVIDLSLAIQRGKLTDVENCNVIISEYNRTIQAFMVGGVDRIVNMNWDEISPPPLGTGKDHFLTAITKFENEIVEILDVEKVLSQINAYDTKISEGVLDDDIKTLASGLRVLLADDSPIALSQAKNVLEQLGLEVVTVTDGAKALERLKKWAAEGFDFEKDLLMLVTDAEMPEMDGYMLTSAIRQDDRLQNIHVVLHTSLSGEFNLAMVDKVGCNDFISKFQPDTLGELCQTLIKKKRGVQ
ncbi:MAG: chemotaxis protein CheV [Pseudomonadales bacterium]|nr:chemotaxis protein CheV [Pseudomonadales bacterium]